MSESTTGPDTGASPPEVLDFYTGLPHRLGDAVSEDDVEVVADLLERLVQAVESAGYPPADLDGPEPDRFPPGRDRIVAAANQLGELLTGLDPTGWDADVGDDTVVTACRRVRRRLIDDHGVPG